MENEIVFVKKIVLKPVVRTSEYVKLVVVEKRLNG